MSWYNAERYPDPTAGEAMDRVTGPWRGRADRLNDDGIQAMVQAVVVDAVKEYVQLLRSSARGGAVSARRRELEEFFLSDWFRRISGLDGRLMLKKVRKAVIEDDRP